MTAQVVVNLRWTNVAGAQSIQSDTDTPAGPGPIAGIQLLAPLQVGWSVDDVLPPVAKPSTASVSWYDDGQSTLLDGRDVFRPMDLGDPVSLHVSVDGIAVVTLQGRVADVAGVNHPAGGVVFTAVLADHLAELASNLATTPVATVVGSAVDLFDYYDALVAGESPALPFNYHTSETTANPFWTTGQPTVDLANVSLLDALNRFIIQDLRTASIGSIDPLAYVHRWLALDIDAADTNPQAAAYRLQEWDASLDELAGIMELVLVAGVYQLLVNDDYYLDHDGLVLYADQLLRDVGEWRKTRKAAVNRVELQSSATFSDGSQTTRRSFTDLVAAYGPNTRSVAADMTIKDNSITAAYALLGARDQVQLGYGLAQATLLWEQLRADQLASLWPDILWPAFGRGVGGIYAYPLAIVDVPDTWRLSDGLVVAGRLMGVAWTISGLDVRAQLTIRAVPPTTQAGVTYLGLPSLMSYANMADDITYEHLTLVED